MNEKDNIENRNKIVEDSNNLRTEIDDSLIYNNEKDYSIEDDWEPEWIRIAMAGVTITKPVEDNGVLYEQQTRTSDGYIDIPANLVDEVEAGTLSPSAYTQEQLRQMAIDKHRRELENSVKDSSFKM